MIFNGRLFIVQVFVLITLINTQLVYFQPVREYFSEKKEHFPGNHTVAACDYILLNNINTERNNKNYVSKIEIYIPKINLWRSTHKIAFSDKDLDISIRNVKLIFYTVKLFSPPDISFPFDYFW
ncbi:MAG TPA: hypothetical protein PK910_10125 [Bacteroidales bacterium]|nr:hypothetical protein [Bacteroidales bacterium]HRC90358.1 hypothetical protein [Bacteroidales bacterium]